MTHYDYGEELLARARAMRAAMDVAAERLDDADASRATALFFELTGEGSRLVRAGTRVVWEDLLFRAAVDVWDRPENWPDRAPTLWERIAYCDGVRIIPDPITAASAFARGERGWWQGAIYQSLQDANVWTPSAAPSLWQRA